MKQSSMLGLLSILLLQLLSPFVVSQSYDRRLCNGRGYRDAYGLCRCIANFHGQNCEYQYCPFGPSWLSPPVANDERNTPTVECSNMGYCDIFSGQCICREGYEGRACERISCPTTALSDGTKVPCAGNGVCKTLRDAGREFDGFHLINPPIEYTNWDADRIQGCVCDAGYEGPDCSRRTCPLGRDPLSPTIDYDTDEVFVLQCRATSGYFHIQFLGQYSDPIPFDADMAFLEAIFHSFFSSHLFDTDIRIDMPSDPTTGLATICAETYVQSTSISFSGSVFQDYPPMRLLRNVSSDQSYISSLSHSTSEDFTLRMSTKHVLSCPPCPACSGNIFFVYEDVYFTEAIDVMATGAVATIRTAIEEQLTPLQRWKDVNISVSYSQVDAICDTTDANTITIEFLSEFGNLPFMEIIDATASTTFTGDSNITFTTNAGNATLYPCSNQGQCDASAGLCQCIASFVATGIFVNDADLQRLVNSSGGFLYRAISGDGRGEVGSRGDCGHVDVPLQSCVDVQGGSVCNGHGECVNRTCQCFDGWAGLTCSVGTCPSDRAWFDEPVGSNLAHRMAECSNAGYCDRSKGMCVCRSGFSGKACQIRDCPRSGLSGAACQGRGHCMSLRAYSEMHGFSYGNASRDDYYLTMVDSSTWDATVMYECVCGREFAPNAPEGDLLHPMVAPNSLISGTVSSAQPLPGFSNWDCAARNCPMGPDSRPYFPDPQWEEQRVVCQKSAFNESDGFRLFFYAGVSGPIYPMSTITEIKRAIEVIPMVGNVTVWMPNSQIDGIHHACATGASVEDGGFVVRFLSPLGDLPLMRAIKLAHTDIEVAGKRGKKLRQGADPYVYTGFATLESADNVYVFDRHDGLTVSNVCSSTALGFCEPTLGSCICNRPMGSSDGAGGPGARGDCSYRDPHPDAQDIFHRFGKFT